MFSQGRTVSAFGRRSLATGSTELIKFSSWLKQTRWNNLHRPVSSRRYHDDGETTTHPNPRFHPHFPTFLLQEMNDTYLLQFRMWRNNVCLMRGGESGFSFVGGKLQMLNSPTERIDRPTDQPTNHGIGNGALLWSSSSWWRTTKLAWIGGGVRTQFNFIELLQIFMDGD